MYGTARVTDPTVYLFYFFLLRKIKNNTNAAESSSNVHVYVYIISRMAMCCCTTKIQHTNSMTNCFYFSGVWLTSNSHHLSQYLLYFLTFSIVKSKCWWFLVVVDFFSAAVYTIERLN